MSNKFKIGQTVGLVSGSPTMTVETYLNDISGLPTSIVSCVWFNGSDVKKAQFHEDLLEVIDNSAYTMA